MVTNNALNITATGIVKYDGAGTFTATNTTNHNVLIGSTSDAITNVPPSATTGIALVSAGAAVDPAFGTVVVAGGGTGTTSLTNHGVLLGQGTSPVVATAAGTAGQILQSGGASADPAYSTATFPTGAAGTAGKVLISDGTNWVASTPTFPNASATGGKQIRSDGTNWVAGTIIWGNALTANNLLYASSSNTQGQLTSANNGTLVTGNTGVPSILAGPGTTGNILQSNAAAAPSFSSATYPSSTTSQQILYSTATNTVGELTTANSKFPATNSSGTLAMRALSVVIQTFTAGGTYTPTAGMLYCIIEVQGSGGAGGGAATTTAAQISSGAGGGGGEYARGVFSAATVGASQTVTIGAGGTAGTAGNNPGNNGNTTSVGALITAAGGSGGNGGAATATGNSVVGGAGGTGGSGGSFRSAGSPGGAALNSFGAINISGRGGASHLGGGALEKSTNSAGGTGQVYGSGGSGGANSVSRGNVAGGVGAAGLAVITEYVIA